MSGSRAIASGRTGMGIGCRIGGSRVTDAGAETGATGTIDADFFQGNRKTARTSRRFSLYDPLGVEAGA